MAGIHERPANVKTFENTVDTSANVDFGGRSIRVIVTNDSATKDLSLKLHTGSDAMTLKPTETITLPFRADKVTVLGNSVPYRIWVLS